MTTKKMVTKNRKQTESKRGVYVEAGTSSGGKPVVSLFFNFGKAMLTLSLAEATKLSEALTIEKHRARQMAMMEQKYRRSTLGESEEP